MYEMVDMHSKYDNMHKNGIFYAKICINNHIIICINYMLSPRYTLNFLEGNEILLPTYGT